MKQRFFATIVVLLVTTCSGFAATGSFSDGELIAPGEPVETREPVGTQAKVIQPVYHYGHYDFRYRHPHFHEFCGCAVQKIVLDVKDPLRCGCLAKVPVCVPACCKGAPKVDVSYGLLGRGYVTFCWKCGYSVTLSFLKYHHKIIVTT